MNIDKNSIAIALNALLILILSGVLLSAFYVQFVYNEKPCPLCMLQRLGMIGVAVGALLNLRFGIRPQHYAVMILSTIVGSIIALRHILFHICSDSPLPDHLPVLGFHLYTWSFIVFTCSLITITVLLFLYTPVDRLKEKRLDVLSNIAFAVIFLITFANIITTFTQCGLRICEG